VQGWHHPGQCGSRGRVVGQRWGLRKCSRVCEGAFCLPPRSTAPAQLPQPTSALWDPLRDAGAAPRVPPKPFRGRTERARLPQHLLPGEHAPCQHPRPFPALTPNAFRMPKTGSSILGTISQCQLKVNNDSPPHPLPHFSPRAKQKAKRNPRQAVKLGFLKEYN